MDHGCYQLHILDVGEITWLLKAVEALCLHHLSHNFICHLVTPLVNLWHVDIINKDCHLLASRRAIGGADTLIHIAFNGTLEVARVGSRGEVKTLAQVLLDTVFGHVPIDDDGLGSALLPDQQHPFGLLGNRVDQEVCAYVVYVWH